MRIVIRILLFLGFVIFFSSFSFPLRVLESPQPVLLKEIGDGFFRDGAFEDASRIYQSVISQDSSSLNDRIFRIKAGITARHAGLCSLAVFLLDGDAEKDPELRDYVLYFRAGALCGLVRYTEALSTLERIGTDDLSRAVRRDALELRADVLIRLRRYREANETLNRLIAAVRTPVLRAEYYLTIVKNYYSLGDPENACRVVQKLAESYDRTYPALEAMELFIRHKRERGERMSFPVLDGALDLLLMHRRGNSALRLLNEHRTENLNARQAATLLYHRGRACYYDGRYAEAKKLFLGLNASRDENRYESQALLFLARIALQTGDGSGASQYYRGHIRRYPSSSMVGEIRWKLGWMAEGRKAYAEALEQYRALEKGRSAYRERGLLRMGFCYYEMREYGKAAFTFNKLAGTGREESMKEAGLYWKAVCLHNIGDSTNAAAGFQELIENYPLHYYAFRARQRLGIPPDPVTRKLPSLDSLFTENASMPADSEIYGILKVGDVTGRRYGRDAIEHFKRTEKGRRHGPEIFWNMYYRIGAYNEALAVGIRMRQEARRGREDETDPALLWRVYPPFFNTLVARYAGENNLPAGLVHALMRRESAFEVDVISPAGAIGLMQMLPSTGSSVGKDLGFESITRVHLAQAVWNIRLGTRHLRDLIDSFDGILPAAVASYNAGEGPVRRWMAAFGTEDIETFVEAIEYTETRNYVKRVLGDYWIYRSLYDLEASSVDSGDVIE